MTVAAWCEVEADSPEKAMEEAQHVDARDFDYDIATAEVEFNVTPATERVA